MLFSRPGSQPSSARPPPRLSTSPSSTGDVDGVVCFAIGGVHPGIRQAPPQVRLRLSTVRGRRWPLRDRGLWAQAPATGPAPRCRAPSLVATCTIRTPRTPSSTARPTCSTTDGTMSSSGQRNVVRGGLSSRETGRSSYPITETSPGDLQTDLPGGVVHPVGDRVGEAEEAGGTCLPAEQVLDHSAGAIEAERRGHHLDAACRAPGPGLRTTCSAGRSGCGVQVGGSGTPPCGGRPSRTG